MKIGVWVKGNPGSSFENKLGKIVGVDKYYFVVTPSYGGRNITLHCTEVSTFPSAFHSGGPKCPVINFPLRQSASSAHYPIVYSPTP